MGRRGWVEHGAEAGGPSSFMSASPGACTVARVSRPRRGIDDRTGGPRDDRGRHGGAADDGVGAGDLGRCRTGRESGEERKSAGGSDLDRSPPVLVRTRRLGPVGAGHAAPGGRALVRAGAHGPGTRPPHLGAWMGRAQGCRRGARGGQDLPLSGRLGSRWVVEHGHLHGAGGRPRHVHRPGGSATRAPGAERAGSRRLAPDRGIGHDTPPPRPVSAQRG